MAAILSANIRLTQKIKTGLQTKADKEETPPLLDRFRNTFTGGLQNLCGTGKKPASFSLRLKTLHPPWRGNTSDFFLCVGICAGHDLNEKFCLDTLERSIKGKK